MLHFRTLYKAKNKKSAAQEQMITFLHNNIGNRCDQDMSHLLKVMHALNDTVS